MRREAWERTGAERYHEWGDGRRECSICMRDIRPCNFDRHWEACARWFRREIEIWRQIDAEADAEAAHRREATLATVPLGRDAA